MQQLLKERVVPLADLPLSFNKPEGVCAPELALLCDILWDIWSPDWFFPQLREYSHTLVYDEKIEVASFSIT